MNPLRPVPAILALLVSPLKAEELAPFYLIETFLTDGVLLHFDTVPFRRYELQATTNLSVVPPDKIPWVTLYTVPAVPFENHYIILDSRTNAAAKCYRIIVSP